MARTRCSPVDFNKKTTELPKRAPPKQKYIIISITKINEPRKSQRTKTKFRFLLKINFCTQ